jgi:hypothetical protein
MMVAVGSSTCPSKVNWLPLTRIPSCGQITVNVGRLLAKKVGLKSILLDKVLTKLEQSRF